MIITGAIVTGARMVGTDTAAAATDEYFNLVTLLLPGNGTNGAQNNTFQDSSTNALTVTRNGNTTQGTFSPFSQTGWSALFDGSGDQLDFAANSAFTMGTGDFTIELWYYLQTSYAAGNAYLFDLGSNGTRFQLYLNQIYFTPVAGSSIVGSAGVGMTINTWYHLAVVRSGSTVTLYLNGTSIGTNTNSNNLTDSDCRIGEWGGGGGYSFNGYISNFRIVKGTAVYTSAFTPPTAPLTAITNTSVLTCQSNRFIDNSTNAFTITPSGNTAAQAFSPFDPATAYAAGTVGGSAYFDGSGDYLSVADNDSLDGFTADFTVEFWVYFTASIGDGALLDKGWNAVNTFSPYLFLVNGGNILLYSSSGGGLWNIASGSSFGTVPVRTWNHICICRSGSALRLFKNGSVMQTITTTATFLSNSSPVTVGSGAGGVSAFVGGYISDVRIVKGTAVYTDAFTPPTAPLTAITNTSLLLSYTNGGITDATAKNVLETVGSAQISTAQSKWGGSSIYLDGTGDYLLPPPSQAYAFKTGDFTIELWIKTSSTADDGILQISTTAGGFATSYTNGLMLASYLGTLYWALNGSSVNTSTTINDGNWHHIAMTRSGSTVRVFKNGTQISTATNAGDVTATNLVVGGYYQTAYTLDGYINDLRFTKGLARYTTTFTPPTAAFPTQ